MGAMPWYYITKWEADLRSALLRAQEETLTSGSYAEHYRGFVTLPPSPTVEEVREAFRDAGGSASVIDIRTLASRPGPEVAGPFSADVLLDLFGTLRPSREIVFEKLHEVQQSLGRGEAAYVLLYKDEQPVEILFVGYSAD